MENNNEEYCAQNKVLFAAGTAIVMVCLKGAVMVSFAEQWRWWVFILLNLVLLAIFFMSMSSASTSTSTSATKNQESSKDINTESKKQSSEEADKNCSEDLKPLKKENCEEEEEEEDNTNNLSKEELNERVEAFIVMFRKHLATDAQIGGATNRQLFRKHSSWVSSRVTCSH